MAPSVIEKYELILAADPRSRIFVELARALLAAGDSRRATEVCRAGLEHHPKSILGRITWGRALLAAGDAKGAHDQFDIAIGIDPGVPYAYNLVGDVLLAAGLFKEALPVLSRAVELQPADVSARTRLDEARRKASGGTAPAIPAAATPAAAGPAPAPAGPTRSAVAAASAPLPAPGPAPAQPPPAAPAVLPPADGVHPSEATTEEMTLRMAFEPLPEEAEQKRRPPAPKPPAQPPAEPPAKAPETREAPAKKTGVVGPRTLLGIIPESGPEPVKTPVAVVDHAEVARAASDYEHELRAKAAHAEAQETAPSKRGRIIALVAVVAVLGGAAGTFAWFRAKSRAEELERTLREARIGLARDTKGSLTVAAEVLAKVRTGAPRDPRLLSLVAQVDGVLAADHGAAAARTLAQELTDPAVAGDGALAARWLLAGNAADKAEAAKALITPPAGATLEPMLHRLAGEVLLARGELDAGRVRLEKAAAASPPLLGALASLGDSYLKAGDAERALAYYEAAIKAHATHPRSVIGAAEARLALSRSLEVSLKELSAVEHDAASPPPVGERLRFELAFARVLAGVGEVSGGAQRLVLAAGALGDSSRLESTRAGLLLGARRYEEAEVAAAKAVRLDPKAVEYRLLLARARNGAHHHAAALQALEGQEGRGVWLERGIASHLLGKQEQARDALERTIRDGKMPADAAVWYARSDVALGHAGRAVTLLTRLTAAPGASALAQASLGEALLAAKRPADAEVACKAAVARDDKAPEGHRCLGKVLLAGGHAALALPPLERAVALDPADPEAKRLLAQARPAGQPKPAAPKAAPAKAPIKKAAPKKAAK